MNEQKVKDWMTDDPITATSDMTLPQAYRLMKENDIRHLPVIENGELVGIVTWEDIREASASEVMTLQIFELHYLLDQVNLRRIMKKNPVTITPLTTLSLAAKIMLKHKITGLPVMDHAKLVGIITESDIFHALGTVKAA
jgi:acetoin utilization protein AcuB